jgi:hypothetical protein
MDHPRTPNRESVGRGGAPDPWYLVKDRRGDAGTAFGAMAGVIACLFVGGLIIAGHFGGDLYADVIRTFERTLGL